MDNAKERQQARDHRDQKSRRIREQLLRGPDKWVHHVVDLSADGEVRSFEQNRPIAVADRLERLSAIAHTTVSDTTFALPERTLTPRAPYQASPVSYLDAYAGIWSLFGGQNELQWERSAEVDPTFGAIDFSFQNVTPGSARVVSIYLSADTTGRNATGNLEVVTSIPQGPVIFPFTGFTDQTLDIVVRPDADDPSILVVLVPGDGVDFLVFREVTYGTVGS